MMPEFKFCVLNCDKQCYLSSPLRLFTILLMNIADYELRTTQDSSEPRLRHCVDSYSQIEGLKLEMLLTALR